GHGPQLEEDSTWTGSFSSDLRVAACSGTALYDIAKGRYEMGDVGKPELVIMTSGGNNAGFAPIVDPCTYHSDFRHNYGPAFADDPDGNGECARALQASSRYIENDMENDLILTINDLLDDPSVKDNPDFLLYLTGYAQFFGTDYPPWCDQERWDVLQWFTKSPAPHLSTGLRRAFNDRVTKINNLYRRVIEDNFAEKARYIDIDSRFAGHRFCEPGATHAQQFVRDTKFDGLWLWNLNYFGAFLADGDVDPGTDDNVTERQAEELFPNGGDVTAWSGSGGDNTVSAGWRQRPFHPRYTGHKGIKDAIIAQLKIDGLPKEKTENNQQNTATASSSSPGQTSASAPEPTPPSPPLDYTPGRCSFHLIEGKTCEPNDSNLYARIRLFDNSGWVILGETDGYDEGPGDPINADAPLRFNSKLPHDLVVVGEHDGGYVQFNYNGLSWTSRGAEGEANCKTGRWDPRVSRDGLLVSMLNVVLPS
ncbi:MAG: hypothetical protein Q9183_002990, partial [Haloplaca sp. 2 TL-2023]